MTFELENIGSRLTTRAIKLCLSSDHIIPGLRLDCRYLQVTFRTSQVQIRVDSGKAQLVSYESIHISTPYRLV